jgi:hypothetical protein
MADYFPLIARAVAGLDKNTGENRRVLYERARTALVNQLRSVEPALEESDITRERLALEEAIRKVEADAAKRSRPEEEAAQEQSDSLRDQALRSFRDTVAEVEGLGDASAEANRAARATYGAVQREMPEFGQPPHELPEPEHYFEAPAGGETPAEAEPPPMHRPPEEHHPDEDAYTRPARSYSGLIKLVIVLLLIAGIAGAGYWQRQTITGWVASVTRSTPVQKPREVTPPGRPKIADRIGTDNADSANAPAAAVAQKVVLYEEDANDPSGNKRYVGSAVWRTETVSPGTGLAPELAIRADVEIPERKMRMTWSLRRNTDKALPASHTIEIMFTLPADFDQGGIGNVPGVLMKQNEQARGQPLAGLAVKVTNGYFLIGLSAVDIDVQRNSELLKQREWFDIPLVYTSGKRAILAVEKGTPGDRAFDEAFRAWGQ